MSQAPGVGVGIVVTREKQVLLLKRKNVHGSGSWSTPGGHLEYGETPEECALREVMEETGVRIGEPRFIGITNDVFEEYGKHYITIWMVADVKEGSITIGAPYEMSEVGWFDWDRLPEPLFLPLKQLLSGRSYPSMVFRSNFQEADSNLVQRDE
jgi:8-oxo-dGTP diphosphatase